MVNETGARVPLPPPNGMFDVRIDEKGRVALPAGHRRFLESCDDSRVFITSLDGRRVHVFSQAVWRTVEDRMRAAAESNPALKEVVERFLTRANLVGVDTEMDKQGRVVLPSRLRARMPVENTTAYAWAPGDRVEMIPEAEMAALEQELAATSVTDHQTLFKAGLI